MMAAAARRWISRGASSKENRNMETTTVETLESYQLLAEQLDERVAKLKGFYHVLDSLLSDEAQLVQDRALVHNELNTATDPSILREASEQAQKDLDFQHARACL